MLMSVFCSIKSQNMNKCYVYEGFVIFFLTSQLILERCEIRKQELILSMLTVYFLTIVWCWIWHWTFKMSTDLVKLLYQSLTMYLLIHTLIQALCLCEQVLPSSMLDNPQNADEKLAKGIQHLIQVLLHFKSSLIHPYCMLIIAFF